MFVRRSARCCNVNGPAFRLLSWNIRQGGGTRVLAIADAIVAHAPHVIVVSEFRHNKRGEQLSERLAAQGYEHQCTPEVTGNTNAVMIASRLPCAFSHFADRVDDFEYGLLRAEFEAFDILGAYLPHKKKHTWFDVILEEVASRDATIIAGDLNTGKNGVDQAGNSFWYTEKLEALEAAGYVDAFRLKHKDREEYSWFSHQGNGYRYDHTYVHPALIPFVADCDYSQKEREDKLSDHAVMLLDLELDE